MKNERCQDRLYHDLLLSEETLQVRKEIREFAEENVAPLAHDIGQRSESKESFPRALFKAMGSFGLFRIPFGREMGGRGLKRPITATVTAVEELAYHSNSIAAIYDVHCILAGSALNIAIPAVRERYLEPLLAGDIVGAFATTEPEASSDLSPQAIRTAAKVDGNGYTISGLKRFITNAPVADFVIVLCRTDAALTTFLVDMASPGVSVSPPDLKLGNRGQLTADIHFDGVHVPAAHIIGGLGKGLNVALMMLTYGRVGIAASGVGMAQAVFDESVARLLERKAFGKVLAQFQHWQFRMAEYATRIECARNLYLKAASRIDDGETSPEPEAAMAKFFCTELACDIARDGIQVLGGYGFMHRLANDGSTFRAEEIYRDSKITEIYEGANEIQKWLIARTIFGRQVVG
jgi:alkylation response protein AidB-like acyl-CoA dehydrogenase